MTWQDRVLAATEQSQLGAIIRCAIGRNEQDDVGPAFVGRASITSDGFVMCSFVDYKGNMHHGAFVGDVHDLERNVQGVCEHVKLEGDDKMHFYRAIKEWIALDYRQTTGLLLG